MKTVRFIAVCLLAFFIVSCANDDGFMNLDQNVVELSNVSKESSESSRLYIPCTIGYEVNGDYTNIGGGGGIPLNQSASSFPSPYTRRTIYGNTLYRYPMNPNNMVDNQVFQVFNSDDSDIMVRVVAKTANNYWLVVSAKKVEPYETISIKVCNDTYIQGGNYDKIHFELYAYNNGHIEWFYN